MVVAIPPSSRPPGPFHSDPPLSPRHLYDERRALVAALAAIVVLTALASFDGGRVLRDHLDEPIQRWIVERRSGTLEAFFTRASRLGDNLTVFPLAAAMFVVAVPRCRFLAMAIVAAVVLRPAFEYVIKDLVGRERPDIEPLGEFMGPSHPSGHPMAFLSVWGLLPPVLALYGVHDRVWWVATAFVPAGAVAVAGARVYRGAHWTSDVVASLLWASLFLLAVQLLYEWAHRNRVCRGE